MMPEEDEGPDEGRDVAAGDGEDFSDGGDDHRSPGEKYGREFKEMSDRFNNWMEENGFEKATNIHERAKEIIDRYRINTGDFEGWGEFEKPEPSGRYSLLDRGERERFHIERIDPRAFDFVDIVIFAVDRGYRVGSTLGDSHGEFSFHYDGRAVDIRTKGMTKEEIAAAIADFEAHGLRVYDETDKSKWTKETTGFHLHVDTGTRREVIERHKAKEQGLKREDLGLGRRWPLRLRD